MCIYKSNNLDSKSQIYEQCSNHSFDKTRLRLNRRAEIALVVAVQVWSVAHPENVTESFVKTDAILLLLDVSFPALQPTVDDVGNHSISYSSQGGLVAAGRTPFPGHPSWQEGFGGWAVIHNDIAVLNETMGLLPMMSGLFMPSNPIASPVAA